MENILKTLKENGVVPVVALPSPDQAVPLTEALMAGGITVIEITYRTAGATEAIRNIAQDVEGMTVGAGTVLTLDQAKAARDAGAAFVVTPGFSPSIVDNCLDAGMPVYPGVATPTEITQALERGLKTVKFFPAEVLGGVKALKALSGPFTTLQFIPTGGVSPQNLTDYLSLGQVLACGGSWLAKKAMVTAGEFETITKTAREARQMVDKLRG